VSLLSLVRRLLSAYPHRSSAPGATSARSDLVDQAVEVDPERVRDLILRYAPEPDGAPDAGEIVWTWIPYAEHDGRGKDRPVLVIARHDAQGVYAVKLTSRSHDGRGEFISIGTGRWDRQGRESWVDLDRLYLLPEHAVRREGATLGRKVFARVAAELSRRFGWPVAS